MARFDAVVRSEIEHAQQGAVVSSWPFEVPGDASGVTWHWRETSDASQRPHRGLQPSRQIDVDLRRMLRQAGFAPDHEAP